MNQSTEVTAEMAAALQRATAAIEHMERWLSDAADHADGMAQTAPTEQAQYAARLVASKHRAALAELRRMMSGGGE